MSRLMIVLAAIFSASFVDPLLASAINLSASQDVMVVQDLSTANALLFDQFFGTTFGGALEVEGSVGHAAVSLIQFDLSSLSGLGITTGANVQDASLHLFTVPSSTAGLDTFGVANPTSSTPITVGATAVAASWSQSTVAWSGTSPTPATTGGVVGSGVADATGEWVTIDVSSLVRDWLNGTKVNDGILLSQVNDAIPRGGGAVGATFASSRAAANTPYLSVVATPEPSTMVMSASAALFSIVALAVRRKRADRGADQLVNVAKRSIA